MSEKVSGFTVEGFTFLCNVFFLHISVSTWASTGGMIVV